MSTMMANLNGSEKWYFTKEQLDNTPSRKCGYSSHKELFYRQKTAYFIHDMGKMLQVSTLCVCTAIVYMHRFYTFHSFTDIPWHQLAAAALFLAAKAQEQPRNLEYVIRVANMCRNPRDTVINLNSERYKTQSHDLVFLENVLLQTLGFDLDIDIPHSYIITYFGSQRTSRQEISRTMANASLHLTTMCLQYKPTVVACVCINVACNRCNLEIPLSNEDKEWYKNVDPTITAELLQQLTKQLSVIYDSCSSSLTKKFRATTGHVSRISSFYKNSAIDTRTDKVIEVNGKDPHLHRSSYDSKSVPDVYSHKQPSSRPHESCSGNHHHREREYKERKEQKMLAAQQKVLVGVQSKVHHSHHHPSINSTLKAHVRPHSSIGLTNKTFRYPSQNQEKETIIRDSQECNNSNKEMQKCDYILKANVQTDVSSVNNNLDSQINYNSEKPTNGSKEGTSEIPSNEDDLVLKRNELNPYYKSKIDNISKHLSASVHDKTNVELPFNEEISKQNVGQTNASSNTQHTSGSCNTSSYNSPVLIYDVRIKSESGLLKNEIPTLSVHKRPSLFSLEKFPLHKSVLSYSPSFVKERYIKPKISVALSPFSSPANVRNITFFSIETVLKLVMEKINQEACFKNLICNNTICNNKIYHQIPDAMMSLLNLKGMIPYEVTNEISVACSENVESPDIILCMITDDAYMSTFVSSEFKSTKIHNVSNETPLKPHLPAVAVVEKSSLLQPTVPQQIQPEVIQKRYYCCKSKKKNDKHRCIGRKGEKGKINKHNDNVREAVHQKTLMSGQSEVPHHPLDHSILKAHFKSKNDHLKIHSERRNVCDSQSKDSNREARKPNYLFKGSVQTDVNSLNNYPSKIPPDEYDSAHTNKESKLHLTLKTDEIKKRVNGRASDKISPYLNKSLNSTSLKVQLPLGVETSKYILKQNIGQMNVLPNTQHPSGSSNGTSYNPILINDGRIKLEPGLFKDEISTHPVIKRSSLFSPKKTPLHKRALKESQSSVKKQNEMPKISVGLLPCTSKVNMGNMNYSSISSPKSVLIPVMEKIDKVKGFESLMRDNTININKIRHQIPALGTPLCTEKKGMSLYEGEKKLTNEVLDSCTILNPPDNISHLTADGANLSALVNSLELNPTIIRDLPKETPSLPHSPADAFVENSSQPEVTEVNHPKSKKNNKKKRNVKSKKDNKNKHKNKERLHSESIEINVCKYKNQPSPECSLQSPSSALKMQITKNKKTDKISELSQLPPVGDLKIKMSKKKVNSCSIISDIITRKRGRELASLLDVSQNKIPKLNHSNSK